ncbi:hypothetical protein Q8F55_003259 [Vanrija albida]|uniref:Major facilitator superfamily (MFS) profile domain-containing protein n=1 Tax=Vanrija albida TaxID=181172 RepID=A0ABR3QCZ1_9TREE
MSDLQRKPSTPSDDEKVHAVHVEDTAATLNRTTSHHKAHVHYGLNNNVLEEAIAATNIPRWSAEARRLYLSLFVSLCCSYANGFDGSVMSSLIVMDFFQDRFHMGFTGGKVSAVFGSYVAANFISTPIAAIVMDKYGRRPSMIAGSIMVIIGAVIATTAKTLAQLVVARFVLGFGISWSLAAGAYCMEISLPHWRGRCTGLFNGGYWVGSIFAAAASFGCNYIQSHLSWQIPLILQCFCALLVVIICPFCPESPRFLMRAGREDEALNFLAKYHGGGDPNAPLVKLEFSEMKASIAADDHSAWWDYSILWKTKARRWRTIQVMMIGCFSQYCGIGLAYFTTVMFKNAGVNTVVEQLGYGLLFSGLCAVGSTIGAGVSDHLRRRTALTIGSICMAVQLACFAAANAIIVRDENRGLGLNASAGKAAIAFWMIYGFTFGFVYTPLQFVVAGEAATTDMRAKAFAVFNGLMTGMGMINTFAGPIALGTIGAWKYAIVFVVLDLVQAGCWHFFGVEAQGRTIEELDWIYDQPNPVKASKKRD